MSIAAQFDDPPNCGIFNDTTDTLNVKDRDIPHKSGEKRVVGKGGQKYFYIPSNDTIKFIDRSTYEKADLGSNFRSITDKVAKVPKDGYGYVYSGYLKDDYLKVKFGDYDGNIYKAIFEQTTDLKSLLKAQRYFSKIKNIKT